MVLKWIQLKIQTRKEKKKIEQMETPIEEPYITPLIEVKGIGKLTVAKFESQGITTVEGLAMADSKFLGDTYNGIFTTAQLRKFKALAKAH